jgi:hypothetical protein
MNVLYRFELITKLRNLESLYLVSSSRLVQNGAQTALARIWSHHFASVFAVCLWMFLGFIYYVVRFHVSKNLLGTFLVSF